MVNLIICKQSCSLQWELDGKLHRINKPAELWFCFEFKRIVNYQWVYNGHWIDCHSKKEFDRKIKLRLLW
jgi:hypothetical protein